METFLCDKKCCNINIKHYEKHKDISFKHRNSYKSGVFIYDSEKDKILLVQSRGNFWGNPKGSLKYGEDIIKGAIREVKEETNLDIKMYDFNRKIILKNQATYFYSEISECPVSIRDDIYNNDVNGITWIKTDCLFECVKNGNIKLTKHFIEIFKIFIKSKVLPKYNFILV
jgi:8-oxo-dGTP pyrophosphatase MutT (NUDIX family)